MPIYEYRCQSCRKRSTLFLRSFSDTRTPACSHCGSADLTRLISTFAVVKPFGESLSWMPSMETLGDVDEDDPKSMARWLHRMKREGGEEFGSEVQDTIDEMEAGEFGGGDEGGAEDDF